MITPSGEVTFLFTDIEGSTRLAQKFPDKINFALERHNSILKSSVESNFGFIFKTTGDAFCCAFENGIDAIKASVMAQRNLNEEEWDDVKIKVRIGIHTGIAEWNGNDYMGYVTLARSSRIMSVSHGGQIIISNDTYASCSEKMTEEIKFRDLGERRLKDLIKPVKLFQILSSGIRADFPPLKTLDVRPNNLPVQLTNFIGREDSIKIVKELFNQTRLLTLTGPGGGGKSRLALQVGADIIDDFENGVFIAELAPVNDPSFVMQALMNSFGIKEEAGKTPDESLLDHLRDKQLLLILDNCEHLIRTCAVTAELLLTNCPELKIIATSRESLNCFGEKTYIVPSLSLPDLSVSYTPVQLSQYESVRLFSERALAVNVNFSISYENTSALAEICSRLDGIPLAIELAAARIKILSVENICERLSNRFSLLTAGKRTALPRQQTLKALIDWSYDLLSEKEKILWERLSVFSGGWTLESAEEICSDEKIQNLEILDLLHTLTEKSIIIYDSDKERYRILETLKQYGEEKFENSVGKEIILRKYLIYFTEFAERAGLKLNSSEIQDWLKKLESELGNFQSAIEWSLSGSEAENGARLAVALGNFWDIRGYYSAGRQLLEKFLINIQSINKSLAILIFRFSGILSCGQSDYRQAQKYFENCLSISREIGEKHGIAKSLNQLGGTIYFIGEYELAQKYYDESLALYRELLDKDGLAACLHNYGNTLSGLGKYEQGQNYLEESLAIRLEIKDKRGMASCLLSLGLLAYNQNNSNYKEAIKFYDECISISREIGLKPELAISLFNIGDCLEINDDNFESALKYFEEALALFREMGHKIGIANSLHGLGNVAFRQLNFEKAKKFYEESLELKRESGERRAIIISLNKLGSTEINFENYDQAKNYYEESITLGKMINDNSGIASAFIGIAEILNAGNNLKESALLLGNIETVIKFFGAVLDRIDKTHLAKITNELIEKLTGNVYLKYFEEGKMLSQEKAFELAINNVKSAAAEDKS